MEGASLLALPEGMQIEQIQVTESGLVIQVAATTPTSCCPLCSEVSSSIHCHYQRTLRDAPCAGRRVQLLLAVRKFTCRNPYCERKVFTERLPAFVEPWARTTLMSQARMSRTNRSSPLKSGVRQSQHMSRKSDWHGALADMHAMNKW